MGTHNDQAVYPLFVPLLFRSLALVIIDLSHIKSGRGTSIGSGFYLSCTLTDTATSRQLRSYMHTAVSLSAITSLSAYSLVWGSMSFYCHDTVGRTSSHSRHIT